MAQKAEIINEIEALSVHCRPPIMATDARAGWLADWCADLGEFGIEAIRVGCRKWRQSEATKFPTPGQLLPFVREAEPVERGPRTDAWRPASDDEYRGMTVREKIRERSILAQEARRKAGPMFRHAGGTVGRPKGEHVAAEDMSDNWRRWTAVAEGHEAEVGRLREYLKRPVLGDAA